MPKAYTDTSGFHGVREFFNENGENYRVMIEGTQYKVYKEREDSFIYCGSVISKSRLSNRQIEARLNK
jgi:hypothetical protein